MDSGTRLTSLQNARVKNVLRLQNRRQRDALRLTVVEGLREASRALAAGVIPREAYYCPEILPQDEAQEILAALRRLAERGQTVLLEVSVAVFARMAYRAGSGGVLLVIPYLEHSLANLAVPEDAFLVIVDGAEKPGNIGAILRTADAAGVHALILTGEPTERTDVHNPNVIRASLGALFTVPVVSTTRAEAVPWLSARGIRVAAATPAAELNYTQASLVPPVAVLVGSEAYGLGQEWLSTASLRVRIPMFGAVDSLNLSVATALLLYEVVRQRTSPPQRAG